MQYKMVSQSDYISIDAMEFNKKIEKIARLLVIALCAPFVFSAILTFLIDPKIGIIIFSFMCFILLIIMRMNKNNKTKLIANITLKNKILYLTTTDNQTEQYYASEIKVKTYHEHDDHFKYYLIITCKEQTYNYAIYINMENKQTYRHLISLLTN